METKAIMKPAGLPKVTPRYRRSSLTKAPRKRTFIANMTKSSIPVVVPVPDFAFACNAFPREKEGAARLSADGGDGSNGNRPYGRLPHGGNGGNSDQPMPLASWVTAGLVVATMLTILSPAPSAHAAESRKPTGYFAVAGFSQPPRKAGRAVSDAIPYGVVELSNMERRMVYGSLQQLNTVERMHV